MTYDELLEVLEHTAQDGMADEPILKALRAVVKMHFNDNEQCGVCRHEWDWPCETIQAIEKELT